MKLLKIGFQGSSLYEGSEVIIDLYAEDRVSGISVNGKKSEVSPVSKKSPIHSLNIVGIAGVNASGKTTTLRIVEFVARFFQTNCVIRKFLPNDSDIPPKTEGSFLIRVIFYYRGVFYYLKAQLKKTGSADTESFSIIDEELWGADPAMVRKKDLSSFDAFCRRAEKLLKRKPDPEWSENSVLSADLAKAFGEDVSIFRLFTDPNEVTRFEKRNSLKRATHPSSVVKAFDPSVEYLLWDEDAEVYKLKFVDEPERIISGRMAETILSSGTVAGADLVENAIAALSRGGYMIIDEIENHLNKSLVTTVMDLFISPQTNPKGATLIFSTHYPEILDELGRKDDLYLLVRSEGSRARLVKYSTVVSRVEKKKSEALLSGLIRGTNPSYQLVRDMRCYVRKAIDEER